MAAHTLRRSLAAITLSALTVMSVGACSEQGTWSMTGVSVQRAEVTMGHVSAHSLTHEALVAEDLITLNHQGSWERVLRLAPQLVDDPQRDLSTRIGARIALAFAQLRRGDHHAVQEGLRRFDAVAAKLPPDAWHHREAERIRAALSGLGPYAHTDKQPPRWQR